VKNKARGARTAGLRLRALLLALVLLCALPPPALAAGETHTATILFTHDLHSHFLPQKTADGGESGGYARLKTALDRERERAPDALVLDGGDFSIGSLVQTLYTTQAAELRTMGALGYDATTIGNHEFDHKGTGFAAMLNAAVLSGDPLPALLEANYTPAPDNPDKLDIQRAMAAYGVKESMLLERGGVTYGIFGIMGRDSDACAPTSGFVLEDPADAAQRCVDELKSQGAQFIIALAHSGTNEKKKLSEDEQLAEKVEGIDLIVSGHTHTTLSQPIVAGDTYIVSAGPYCQNLGTITLEWSEDGGKKTLTEYRLTPIDETIPDDPETASLVESWKARVEGTYLGRYGLTYDQALTTSGFDLNTPDYDLQEGNALGELCADAYLWAAQNLEENSPNADTVAFTASGMLRAPLYAGELTTSMAFDVLSMGVGEDGTSGFPLVSYWLTGRELRSAAEVDASVSQLMPTAQLYVAGLSYSFNVHRMFFNRVTDIQFDRDDWRTEPAPVLGGGEPSGELGYTVTQNDRTSSGLEDGKLYRVISGMYAAEMLGTVKSKSFGLLSIEPKDENGVPITDFSGRVLRQKDGSEIKEWYALAAYLASFGEEGLPLRYASPDGRKQVSRSWNPVELLKNPNWITLAALLVIVLLTVLAVLLVKKISAARRKRRYGKKKNGL